MVKIDIRVGPQIYGPPTTCLTEEQTAQRLSKLPIQAVTKMSGNILESGEILWLNFLYNDAKITFGGQKNWRLYEKSV